MKILSGVGSVSTNNENANSYDFNIGDVGTIIEILRNRLYSNPIQTLTQEYLCNARDSHREAGKADTPIRVTLPTKLESCLKIRDYGVGLSKDRVCDVFVKYGKSTKRTDNLQTGGFGLGAKSAWAYTDSFVIVSYYNGICSTYVAHTGKNSNGTFELINETETNEPNGVEVQIPIKESDIPRFVKAVYRTTYFWDTRPELLGITDIEIPKNYSSPDVKYQKNNLILVPVNEFTENLFETRHIDHKTFVLIDKIPYNISRLQYQVESLNKLNYVVHNNNIMFIEVNNGDIDVAASREEVANDASNITKLEAVCNNAFVNIWGIVSEEFNKTFNNLRDYMKVYSKLRGTFTFSHVPKDILKLEYVHKNIKFNVHGTGFVNCDKTTNVLSYYEEEQDTRTVIRCEKVDSFSTDADDRVVIKDIDLSDVIIKRKIKKLFNDNENCQHVYLVECPITYRNDFKNATNALLLSELKHDAVSYTSVKKAKGMVSIYALTVERGRNGSRAESCEKTNILLEDLETKGTYVLANPEKHDFRNENNFVCLASYLIGNGVKLIKCNKTDYAKVSNLKNVIEFDDFVKNLEKSIPLSNEKLDQYAFSSINNTIFALKKYADSIECPKINKLLSLYPTNSDRRSHIDPKILSKYSYYATACANFEKAKNLEEEVTKEYPLLCAYYYGGSHGYSKEFVYYINNKYQKEYSKKLIMKDGKFCRE